MTKAELCNVLLKSESIDAGGFVMKMDDFRSEPKYSTEAEVVWSQRTVSYKWHGDQMQYSGLSN